MSRLVNIGKVYKLEADVFPDDFIESLFCVFTFYVNSLCVSVTPCDDLICEVKRCAFCLSFIALLCSFAAFALLWRTSDCPVRNMRNLRVLCENQRVIFLIAYVRIHVRILACFCCEYVCVRLRKYYSNRLFAKENLCVQAKFFGEPHNLAPQC